MSFDYYDMQTRNKKKLNEWAKEKGWPMPSSLLNPLFLALVHRHRLSLVAQEIDATIDRLMLLKERIDEAIAAGSLVCVMLLRDRQEEEKKKLAALERLLDKESPMGKKDETTDRMIDNAKQYPMEDLLASYGCQVRMHRTRCVIHDGKNPTSFEVKNNSGRCHSCNWSGDTIEFVRKMEGCSFLEAVRRLQ